MEYVERSITDILLSKINKEQIIVLTGARQTGKTTLCEYMLPDKLDMPCTYISFDDPDERLRFQGSGIAILESIATPLIVLDEVQKIPALFEQLKYVADKRKKDAGTRNDVFILTGSSQLILLKNIKETLAGRVSLLNLYPFSLSEALRSKNAPFITRIWNDRALAAADAERFNLISSEQCRTAVQVRDEHRKWGGYPPVWQKDDTSDKFNWLKDYRKTYVERDLSDVGQVANIDTFVLTQKLLCARTGKLFSLSEVARDASLTVNTVKRYVNLLAASFQCYLVPPYYENICKRLIKSPKIYFPDPGLNRVILGEMTIEHGASYESWVFSEILKWKQLQPIEPDLYFYRTSAGMEVDFLIAGEETILPVEVKSSEKVAYVDGRAIESFMQENKRAALGIIVYPGKSLTEVRKDIWAVPDWFLFGGM